MCVCAEGRGDGGGDSLDQYMSVVSSQLDPATTTRLRRQTLHLKNVSHCQAISIPLPLLANTSYLVNCIGGTYAEKAAEGCKANRNALSSAAKVMYVCIIW